MEQSNREKKGFDIMDTYDMILMFRLRFNARNNPNSTCKCDANLAYSTSTYKQKIDYYSISFTSCRAKTEAEKKLNCLILISVDVSVCACV